MQPVGNKILVLPEQTESVTATGIIIPNIVTDRQRAKRGKVVAAGPDSGVNPGETVLYGQKAGKPINIEGVDHLILTVDENNNEVMAVL